MGTHFTDNTIHSALRWLMSITELSGRLMSWRLRVADFHYEVIYDKGNLNAQAHALSLLGTEGEALPIDEDDEEIPCFLLQEDDKDWDLVSEDVCDDLLISNGEDSESGSFTPTNPNELI